MATSPLTSLPKSKLPREQLQLHGAANLTTTELLTILIGAGTVTQNAKTIAQQITKKYGNTLPQITMSELCQRKGIGVVRSSRIIAALELGRRFFTPTAPHTILRPSDALPELAGIRSSHQEQLLVLYLNARYELLAKQVVAIGTLNTNFVEPRDIFHYAVTLPCRNIILAHNHPSGSTTPSPEDIATTAQLQKAGSLLGIEVIDHLIVTERKCLSLQQEGLL